MREDVVCTFLVLEFFAILSRLFLNLPYAPGTARPRMNQRRRGGWLFSPPRQVEAVQAMTPLEALLHAAADTNGSSSTS